MYFSPFVCVITSPDRISADTCVLICCLSIWCSTWGLSIWRSRRGLSIWRSMWGLTT